MLVSNAFLTSHAYLKDSAVCIRACSLASPVHPQSPSGPNDARTIQIAVKSALRQARLESKDTQIVGAQHKSDAHVRQALSKFSPTQSRGPLESLESLIETAGLAGLCGLGELSLFILCRSFGPLTRRAVWRMRGWVQDRPLSRVQNCLQYHWSQDGSAGVVVLCRSDGRSAPAWSDIENVRDGRERLGYNPAVETRGIAREDLEAVKGRVQHTPDAALKTLQLPWKGGDRAALARL